jgi:photosystem II stability/assembly factor-like uncharacterized protein
MNTGSGTAQFSGIGAIPVRVSINAMKHNSGRVAALAAIAVLLAPAAALAGPGKWTTGGPPGGSVSSLVVSLSEPSVLYAAVESGAVFRSSDSGGSWVATKLFTRTDFGLNSFGLLAVDPVDPNRVYSLVTTIPSPPSVTPTTVFYRTDDGGLSVTGISELGGPKFPTSLVIDPASPSTLYITSHVLIPAESGISKSEDGGLTWHDSSTGIGNGDAGDLVIDPADSRILYVSAGATAGLFRSGDRAASWQPVSLPDGGTLTGAILIGSTAPSIVYVQTGTGIYRGVDPVEVWTRADAGLPPNSILLAIDPSKAETLYAATPDGQIYRSTDAGDHWLPFSSEGLPGQVPFLLAISPDGSSLHAATASGVFNFDTFGAGPCSLDSETLCLNGGRFEVRAEWNALRNHWSGAGKSHPLAADTGAFWFFTANNLELMVKVVDGRAVNGKFWVFAGGLSNVQYSITVRDTQTGDIRFYQNPQDQLTSFADTSAFDGGGAASAVLPAGVGQWTTSGPVSGVVSALAIAPTDSRELLASVPLDAVYRSVDAGTSWARTSVTTPHGKALVAFDPLNSSSAYALVPDFQFPYTTQSFLFHSTDAGESWTKAGGPLPTGGPTGLAVVHGSPSTMYVSASAAQFGTGMFKSSDGGNTWGKVADPNSPYAETVVVDPEDPLVLYASSVTGVYRSSDGGLSWLPTSLSDGLVYRILVGSSPGRIVYAGGDLGIYRSLDRGGHWARADHGLPSRSSLLALDPRSAFTVYSSSVESGVQVSTDAGDHWSPLPDSDLPGGLLVNALTVSSDGLDLHAATTDGVFEYRIPGTGGCPGDPITLCLNGGRFRAQVQWDAENIGKSGTGTAIPITTDTGSFWFFTPNNLELSIKVVDGRAVNDHFWVFFGALSDVHYTVTVLDTESGKTRTYENPQGKLASVADTEAF